MVTAKALATRTKTKPRQADLRRAISTAYYAMFHALCDVCATALIGTSSPDRAERAWRQTYRALEHRRVRSACAYAKDPFYSFPLGIQEFSRTFATLQNLRHDADYDPFTRFQRPEVISEISKAELAIRELYGCSLREKAAFAALVLFKLRP